MALIFPFVFSPATIVNGFVFKNRTENSEKIFQGLKTEKFKERRN